MYHNYLLFFTEIHMNYSEWSLLVKNLSGLSVLNDIVQQASWIYHENTQITAYAFFNAFSYQRHLKAVTKSLQAL